MGNGVSRRPIRPNEPILFDYNGCYNGYNSDQTRTLVLGALPEEMERAYAASREILEAAQGWLRPGVGAGEVYARCPALAARLGDAEAFMGQGAAQVPSLLS